MLETTKEFIEQLNTTELSHNFIDVFSSVISILFPVVGAIAVFFIIFKVFRGILNV